MSTPPEFDSLFRPANHVSRPRATHTVARRHPSKRAYLTAWWHALGLLNKVLLGVTCMVWLAYAGCIVAITVQSNTGARPVPQIAQEKPTPSVSPSTRPMRTAKPNYVPITPVTTPKATLPSAAASAPTEPATSTSPTTGSLPTPSTSPTAETIAPSGGTSASATPPASPTTAPSDPTGVSSPASDGSDQQEATP